MMLRILISIWAVAIVLSASGASAATITFSGSPGGLLIAPFAEGDFTISLHSGGIFGDLLQGGPPPDLEGSTAAGGGTFSLKRNDVLGGLFTFDQASVGQFNLGTTHVVFEGYLGGVLQNADLFATSSTNLVHITHVSSLLAGLPIDELRVVLDAGAAPFQWESVDNITVSPTVPEPATGLLMGFGLLALPLLRRAR